MRQNVQQFLRKVRVKAGGLVINGGGVQPHELKVEFSISKSVSSQQNSAEITIYNLAEGNRNALGKELDDIELEAGYMPPTGGSNVGRLFKGQIRDVKHERRGADIASILSCGDGDRAMRDAFINKTFPAGTPVEDVMEEIYKQFEAQGIDRGEWKFPEGMKEFKRPYTLCGTCKNEANIIGRGKGFYWSLQNETMEIIPTDGYIGGIVVLSPQSGLVDVPTITDNGVKFKALLNPAIMPNRRVRIISDTLDMNGENGDYRVSEVTFSGDNRQGKFNVSGTGEAIQGGKVDEGKWIARKK